MPYSLPALQAAARTVHAVMPPTPQYRWPLLEAAFATRPDDGTQVWVKHENHTPVGAFKVRGGLVFFDRLLGSGPGGFFAPGRLRFGEDLWASDLYQLLMGQSGIDNICL